MHNGQLGTGGGGQNGQDFILKSSSDVKVGQSGPMTADKRERKLNFESNPARTFPFAGSNLL